MVKQILNINDKKAIAREILEALPDWFGLPEAREEYIAASLHQKFYVAIENKRHIGFLCLNETGKDTVELTVMGVLKEFHRHGIGRNLFTRAREDSTKVGYSFMQVKTVQQGRYKEYDATNKFYISLGFKDFEIFPSLWNVQNPCQIYVMSLK